MCAKMEAERGISSCELGQGDIFLTNSETLEAGGAGERRLRLMRIVPIETILLRTKFNVK